MTGLYYILTILVVALFSFFGGYTFNRKNCKRVWSSGVSAALNWMTVALSELGWSGKDIEELLTRVAEHLRTIKDNIPEDAGTQKKGGVN